MSAVPNSGHYASSLDHLIGKLLQGKCNKQPKLHRRRPVFEARALGHRFVLDCANDRREYGAAGATGDQL
jgi:hypothetical protein